MEIGTDSRTRDRVMRAVLTHGPVTVADVADRLGLTAAGVRRHLDAMECDGLVEQREPSARGPRGRGRPPRAFVLTARGHSALDGGYDDLALSAIDFLDRTGGRAAVGAFATHRSTELERRYRGDVEAAGPDPAARASALATALSADGYAATARPVERSADPDVLAVQLCQGHCPVQNAAARFPELCEAEAEAFSRLLGTQVRRLATLAGGSHVCTTHVTTHVTNPTGTRRTPTTPRTTTSGRTTA